MAIDESPDGQAQAFQIPLHRKPCASCGGRSGLIFRRNGQNVVRCGNSLCPSWTNGVGPALYNAPKTETGEQQRSVRSGAVAPGVRFQVLEQCNFRCLTCGRGSEHGVVLNVSHVLSVKDGRALGASQHALDHPVNLVAMCEECNLGQSSKSLPPRLALRLLQVAANMMEARRAKDEERG